jgi:hypothetical protein
VASSRAVYTLGPTGVLNATAVPGPVAQADLHRNGIFAVTPGGQAPAKLALELLLQEPAAAGNLAPSGGIAVSDYRISGSARSEPVLAVARMPQLAPGQPLPAVVSVYAIDAAAGQPALVRHHAIPAASPSQILFRPAAP